MTVAANFRAFRGNYLIPGDTTTSISYRYRRLTRQLNKDFWATESESAHSLYGGSYGRDTAADGASDLDIAFTLPASVYHLRIDGSEVRLRRVRHEGFDPRFRLDRQTRGFANRTSRPEADAPNVTIESRLCKNSQR